MRRARRSAPGSGSRRRSISTRCSTGRTISIPTCRRAIRSASTNRRSSARARSWSICRTASAVTVGIERLHLEQDAGKIAARPASQHVLRRSQPLGRRADGDRVEAGPALVRARPRPISTKLRSILRYLGTCDGDMEKGSLRADVNVSVRKPGEPLGTRCEIKNVNSIRFIGQAIEHEARRQIEIIEDGGTIEQETRLFDPEQGRDALDALARRRRTTTAISPIPICCRSSSTQAYVDGAEGASAGAAGREEGALHRRASGCRPTTPTCWSPRRALADYFEAVAKGRDAKAAANWVINELTGRLNKEGKDIADSPGQRGAARRDARSDRGGHDLRQDRQGLVRDRLERGRRPARDRRSSAA